MSASSSKMSQKFKFSSRFLPGGGKVSQWVPVSDAPVVWTGQPGVVGKIVSLMHRGEDMVQRPVNTWKASIDYEFIASKMDKASGEAYIKKSKEWFANLPAKPEISIKNPQTFVNSELMLNLYKKYHPHKPPTEETVETMRQAGYPETAVARVIKDAQWWDENSDKVQSDIDRIFGTAPTKTTTKKVIKAVKKRMPNIL